MTDTSRFHILPRAILATIVALALGGASSVGSEPRGARPVAVSPGNASEVARVEARCPTFSWGTVPGATGYELVVYRLGKQSEEVTTVLGEAFAGAVNGWTPSLDRCLERGRRYAWSVRATGGTETSDWSAPSLFEVATGPGEAEFDEALQVVRKYLAGQAGTVPSGRSGALTPPSFDLPPTESIPAGGPEALFPVTPTALSVDGSIDLGGEVLVSGTVFAQGPGGVAHSNTALGFYSLEDVTPGDPESSAGIGNTAVGQGSLQNLTTGQSNNAFGYRALQTNTTGVRNVAVGTDAMLLKEGDQNTAVGHGAMAEGASGSNNTAIGYGTLRYNTGSYNTALGYYAGRDLTTGANNIHIANLGVGADDATIKIGSQGTQTKAYVAGIYGSPLAGSSVVVTGTGQLGVATGASGDADTVDGFDASATPTANTLLVLDGDARLPADITGNAATATSATSAATATALVTDPADCLPGEFATAIDPLGNLTCATDGGVDHGFATENTRVGSGALASNTTGSSNTAHGFEALSSNTTGSFNTAVGTGALRANTDSGTPDYVGARGNTAVGYGALKSNTEGSFNTAVGYAALYDNTTGYGNTALGRLALLNNTTGSFNVALGRNTMVGGNGNENIAVGRSALYFAGEGSRNTAIGRSALLLLGAAQQFYGATHTGSDNVAVGPGSLRFLGAYDFGMLLETGDVSFNTALGKDAGRAISHGAIAGTSSYSHNIMINNNGEFADEHTIRIGTAYVPPEPPVEGEPTLPGTGHKRTYVAGIYGTDLSLPGSCSVTTTTACYVDADCPQLPEPETCVPMAVPATSVVVVTPTGRLGTGPGQPGQLGADCRNFTSSSGPAAIGNPGSSQMITYYDGPIGIDRQLILLVEKSGGDALSGTVDVREVSASASGTLFDPVRATGLIGTWDLAADGGLAGGANVYALGVSVTPTLGPAIWEISTTLVSGVQLIELCVATT